MAMIIKFKSYHDLGLSANLSYKSRTARAVKPVKKLAVSETQKVISRHSCRNVFKMIEFSSKQEMKMETQSMRQTWPLS